MKILFQLFLVWQVILCASNMPIVDFWKTSRRLALVDDLKWENLSNHCTTQNCRNLVFITDTDNLYPLGTCGFHGLWWSWNDTNPCLVPVKNKLRWNFFLCLYIHQKQFLQTFKIFHSHLFWRTAFPLHKPDSVKKQLCPGISY